ncbi:MAG TPA: Crp/Fnr family transcriptional regulator [Sediminispirochaeta sp.]|nr:Crp/Fnr family transcriptional regulator [Sediminispirochaeta sp.]
MEQNLFEKYGMTVDEGKVFFSEGEKGEHMYIIQEGCVRITKNIDGREHTLAVLGKGEFFGEMAIVTQATRTATATAASTVRLLRFDRPGFLSMIEKNARIALNVIDKLCRRLQHANMQIQHLVRGNQRGLIALNLYYYFTEKGPGAEGLEYSKTLRDLSLSLEFPQEKIQGYIADLREKQILKLEDDRLTLTDIGRLAEIAEAAK